jgi:serine/threonine protein kinase
MFSLVGTIAYSAPEVYKAKKVNGYSKSVDMWSIGSITTTLLAGEPLFAERNYSEDGELIRSRIEKCDLSILNSEYHPVWSTVGDRPKDFIRRLLVLEEEKRMSATEALAHAWFSDPYFAADFEDLYERSIKDWRPQPEDAQLVEQIPTLVPDATSCDSVDSRGSQDVVYGFFQNTPEHDILRRLSAAQRCHANTPLPAIGDDYECGQFASPVAVPTQEQNVDNETERSDSNNYNHSQQEDDAATPVYDEYNTYDSDVFEDDDLPRIPCVTQDEYYSANNDEYGDSTSLDEVMDETYEVLAVNEYCEGQAGPHAPYPPDCEDEVHGVEMVQETPPKELLRQVFT